MILMAVAANVRFGIEDYCCTKESRSGEIECYFGAVWFDD